MPDANFVPTASTLQNGFYSDAATPITAARNFTLLSTNSIASFLLGGAAGLMPNGGAYLDICVSNLLGGANARTVVLAANMTSTGSLVVAGGEAVYFRLTVIDPAVPTVHVTRLG